MKNRLILYGKLAAFLVMLGIVLAACQAVPTTISPTEVVATAAARINAPTAVPDKGTNGGFVITTGSKPLDAALSCVGELLLMALVVGIPLWFLIRAGKKETKQIETLMQKGTPGDAKIIEVGASRTGRSDQKTHVALRLEVVPKFGEAFNAITSWVVEPAHIAEIQTGKLVPVKIVEMQAGKSKTKKFKSIFPDVAWAKLYYWEQEFTEETMKTIDDEDTYIE